MTDASPCEGEAPPNDTGLAEHISCISSSPRPATTNAPFGPWSPALRDSIERGKQFRSLASLAAAYFGSGHRLVLELRQAEVDPAAAARAQELIEALPSLHRRRLFSTFSAITWPRPRRVR
jgi:hypothetical protein